MRPMRRSLVSRTKGALAVTGMLGVVVACSGLDVPPALAVEPPPPPGAPAVESAFPSLVGVTPQLPAGVIAASAAPSSLSVEQLR